MYARGRLEEAGEADVLAGRHARWALALAQRRRTSPRLDRDAANLRAALDLLLARDPPAALALCVALSPFWLRRIELEEARRRLRRRARSRSGTDASTRRGAPRGGRNRLSRRRARTRAGARGGESCRRPRDRRRAIPVAGAAVPRRGRRGRRRHRRRHSGAGTGTRARTVGEVRAGRGARDSLARRGALDARRSRERRPASGRERRGIPRPRAVVRDGPLTAQHRRDPDEPAGKPPRAAARVRGHPEAVRRDLVRSGDQLRAREPGGKRPCARRHRRGLGPARGERRSLRGGRRRHRAGNRLRPPRLCRVPRERPDDRARAARGRARPPHRAR